MNMPFILVDGSSYLHRAFHALPPLTNQQGEPTGAMYGVLNMLRRLQNDYRGATIAVVFDAKGKTFRDDLSPTYKAHRPSMDPQLAAQIAPLHEMIKTLGFPLYCVEGVEADDVIGTLAVQMATQGFSVIISTGDKDMAQLVNAQITLINTMSNTVLDVPGVIHKFGVEPSLIVDYLTLMGDNVDNVAGVPGVGPKTAVKWLKEWGSLEGVLSHADAIKGKVGESLRASLHFLPLSRQLVTIKCDVDLDFNWQDIIITPPESDKLREYYQRYEFKAWLQELNKIPLAVDNATSLPQQDAPAYEIILTKEQFSRWIALLKNADIIALDTETTSLDSMSAKIVGFSFAVAPGKAAYLPVNHDYPDAPTQLNLSDVVAELKIVFANKTQDKVAHNWKYDGQILANINLPIAGRVFDTMLESYVDNSAANRHDLDTLSLKWLSHQNITFEEVAGKGAKQVTFNQVPLDIAGPYAAEDADMCLQLHHILWPRLQSTEKATEVLLSIELPLIDVLRRMETTGVLIDANLLGEQSAQLAEKMAELQKTIFILAGEDFNIDSPKQLQAILYAKLGLPILAKTPTGQASTAESVLQELAVQYELPSLILNYRSLGKLKSTYTDKLPLQMNATTGRVHTSFHQAVTSTGRLSSSDPNLQNIPIRTSEGRRVRQAFIAPSQHVLLSADYSQIELRIMAHLSQDATLQRAFELELDIHKATAAEILDIPLESVTNEQRRHAKAINFGLIYGMSAFGLAKQINANREQAQQYMDKYFKRYPGVLAYMQRMRELAHAQGYVETIFGRRLYLPEIRSSEKNRRMAAERAAINAPMQGTAADIIKRAMIAMDTILTREYPDVKMILQVHDELVFEIPENKIDVLQPIIVKTMQETTRLNVPLVVGIGVGKNWDEAH